MNHLETLVKGLILLILEYKENKRIESIPLIEALLEDIYLDKVKVYNDEQNILIKLKELLRTIVTGGMTPDDEIMVTVEVILNDKPSLLKIIDKYLTKKDPGKVVKVIKKELYDSKKRLDAKKLLTNALAKVMSKSVTIDEVMENLSVALDKVKKIALLNDEALVDEVDFDSIESVGNATQKAKDLINGSTIFKSGWSCFNKMTQGGLRRGEFVTITALQHNYKSGLTKSLFLQSARLNKPVMDDSNKKPLLMFISLEEEIDNIVFFFYTYLKYTIDGIEIKEKDRDNLDSKEMAEYITKHVGISGYSIKLFRYVPESFTYSKLYDLVEKMERMGYEVHGVFLDYVMKMSRAGCDNTGASGTDLKDLFSRIRGYMSKKKILFVTPHQLNTAAMGLMRGGMTGPEFLDHIANKSYYAVSSQLAQEIDLELFLNISKIDKKDHLLLRRGKHRLPSNIPEEDRKIMLQFMNSSSPIPEESEEIQVCKQMGVQSDEFDF